MARFRTCRLLFIAFLICGNISTAQTPYTDHNYRSYCNPVDLDYTYMIYNAHAGLSYRSGADPAVVRFRGEYYMFVTRSMGYWHSKDLVNWDFITPQSWYFEGSNAPAAHNYKDSILYMTGNPSGSMSILYTSDPKSGRWQSVPSILNRLQDPDLFVDDDGRAYMFWGSSNKFPIRGTELDRDNLFKPGATVELFNLHAEEHGWERFGENHQDTVLGGYIEGPWLTKRKRKYYMQYAAPGTEWNVYGDGVYISDAPLGPYSYAPNNPISYKPGGFAVGAGHGSTVQGPMDTYWHFATMALSANVNWERRISLFPTYFDQDDLMYMDTYFGDYPHYVPGDPHTPGGFCHWMLLSYAKPVTASSTVDSYTASNVVDEQIKTFWLSEDNDEGAWIEIDLEASSEIRAIQLNFYDYQSDMYGRLPDLYHRYQILTSVDGKEWQITVDKSLSYKDAPHAYIELHKPTTARYVRYVNVKAPTPHLAISDIRVFGKGSGALPMAVRQFEVTRLGDRRDAILRWEAVDNCQGYNVLWGIAPDKMYNTWLLYGDNMLELKALNIDQSYYFQIEAFNENGISPRSEIIKIE